MSSSCSISIVWIPASTLSITACLHLPRSSVDSLTNPPFVSWTSGSWVSFACTSARVFSFTFSSSSHILSIFSPSDTLNNFFTSTVSSCAFTSVSFGVTALCCPLKGWLSISLSFPTWASALRSSKSSAVCTSSWKILEVSPLTTFSLSAVYACSSNKFCPSAVSPSGCALTSVTSELMGLCICSSSLFTFPFSSLFFDISSTPRSFFSFSS